MQEQITRKLWQAARSGDMTTVRLPSAGAAGSLARAFGWQSERQRDLPHWRRHKTALGTPLAAH